MERIQSDATQRKTCIILESENKANPRKMASKLSFKFCDKCKTGCCLKNEICLKLKHRFNKELLNTSKEKGLTSKYEQ